ncbi:hypothetical protein [uncultured Brachyspira sp.]|uniref:hypothetical protein n=1 Tax=uncultured Brachyspira sp. TaxID=221953 RepID=UPI00262486B6|nr:hypothetical protein [uncultured Brachyspira sp.]
MRIELKLNKEYNDEIVYETMLKMGFYYNYNYMYYSKYNIGNGYNSYLRYAVDENRIARFDSSVSCLKILSECLVENNIMKLSNTEPSTLIDIHYNDGISGSFSKLNNIEQKLCITFIEEFDRIYTSIEKNSSSNLVQSDTNTTEKTIEESSENTDNITYENYLKIALNIKEIKEMFINKINISKNEELKSFEEVSNTFKEEYIKLEAQNQVKQINAFFDKTIDDIENTKDIKDYINKYNKIIIKINEDLNNIVKKTVKISTLVYVIDNITEDDMYEKRDYISQFDIKFLD